MESTERSEAMGVVKSGVLLDSLSLRVRKETSFFKLGGCLLKFLKFGVIVLLLNDSR